MSKQIYFFIFLFVLMSNFAIALPFGATPTVTNTSRATADSAGNNSAFAGNLTEVNFVGNSITQTWQGYFGNVTGAIKLADVSNNVLYNWSLASPNGEIYASNASSVNWTGISCFNMSNSTLVSNLEGAFGITNTDADGVNETFSLNNHAEFYSNSLQFTAGQCKNVKLYNSSAVGVFDEVLMYDGANAVFASLLQQNANGFNGRTYDFEMIVLEDGHGANVATTPYFFWVELQ